ncbi:hypothetical protein VTJ83DRAFT_3437 [Remersonia thermophila]|uniref:HypA protein n=1 Tax=Remersonia thermophila TaxID=72144 RepID=A0ABR4DE02_9PEZI
MRFLTRASPSRPHRYINARRLAMATTTDSTATSFPFKMHVTPDNTGLWHIRQTDEAAKTVSELLQQDMEKHHVFFNQDGFHNHIPHQLLALYGTGAPASTIRAAYAENETYQRPALPPHQDLPVVPFLPWPGAAEPYFGQEKYYPDFLRFFQEEIVRLGGWREVVARYVLGLDLGLKGIQHHHHHHHHHHEHHHQHQDHHHRHHHQQQQQQRTILGQPAAEEEDSPLLTRLFAGFLHPMIQLMYGIEWAQEAVVAEGLAQAAVHPGDIGEFLLAAERLARERQQNGGGGGDEPILSLLASVRSNEKLAQAAKASDPNKVRDGVLARAKNEMISAAARVRVRPEEVEEKTAEMFNAAVFTATAAALERVGRPGNAKPAKVDFFLMHHVTSAPFFVTVNAQPWIPPETKARLLEWKIRMDLLQYAARGAPELSAEKLRSYQPRNPDAGSAVAEIIARLHTISDDGHAIKLGRAIGICRNICQPYEEEHPPKPWLAIRGDEMWKKVCHLVVDSVEGPGPLWVRSTGFDEAWKDIPDVEA